MEMFISFVCMLVCINLMEGIAALLLNEIEVNQSIFNTSYTNFSFYLTSIQITPVNYTVNMSSTSVQIKPVNYTVNISSNSIQIKPVNYTENASSTSIQIMPINYAVNMSSTSIQTMPINYADNVSPTSIQITPVNYTEDVSLVKSIFDISNVIITTTFMNMESYNFPINVNTQINNRQSFYFNTINSTLSKNFTNSFTYSLVPTAKTTASPLVMKTFKMKYDLDFNATVANLSGIINATDVFCKPWLSFNISVSINCSISDGSVFVFSQVRGSQDNLNLYESNVRSSLTSNGFNVMVYNNQIQPDPTLIVIDQSTSEPAASTLNNKSYIVIIVVVVIILISIIIIGAFVHLSKKKKRKVKTKVSSTSSMKELQLNAPLNQSKQGGNPGNQNQAFEE